jgi:hypothetical protein
MKADKPSSTPGIRGKFALGVLAILLALLFWRCFVPGYVQFSNDGPLGQQTASWVQVPQGFTGMWYDINYAGWNGGAYQPHLDAMFHWILGPVGYSKFLVPLALFTLGLGAWFFFRALRLAPIAATLGMFAVVFNSANFSTACWGVASQQIAYGFDFMALALVVSATPSMSPLMRWARIILAGLAVGMNVMEAADIGALCSMFIAVFVFYHAWAVTEGGAVVKISRGVGRVAVIAVSAAFIAAFALSSLIGTQIKGVAGTSQDEATKRAHWDFATQWSFPKRETLTLIAPGIFGYRMDAPDGGNYWGVGGRDPAWWRYFEDGKQGPPPGGFLRQSGGGVYAGVIAVLIAIWAACQSFRKNSVFTLTERRLIWFWLVAFIIALLLAFGRYAPFFQFVYALPYASTVRNPGKFIVIVTFSITVLCAYGVHGLSRGYLETAQTNFSSLSLRLKSWWSKAAVFDRRWTIGCLVAIAVSLVGWGIYALSQKSLEAYLQEVGFGETLSPEIAAFSIRQVGWFLLFLSLGVGMIILILSGHFSGRRAKLGGILLSAILLADWIHCDVHWIKFIDYKQKLETNPILETLRQKPYEHRVAILPFRIPDQYKELNLFNEVYRIEWAQHLFPYFDIQSLDLIQLSRMPADYAAFEGALMQDGTPATEFRVARRWQLTNTRYLLGPSPFLDVLNRELDPQHHSFQIVTTFNIVPKPGIERPTQYEELTAVVNSAGEGQYALFNFAGALPRVKLFTHWRVSTNDPAILKQWAKETQQRMPPDWGNAVADLNLTDQATLKELATESFDPWKTVLLSEPISAPANSASVTNSGTVDFVSYAPKDIKLKAQSAAPTVLLLNDKYDPNWQVRVDGKRADLLRCNFLMRGVYLDRGTHNVEFIFKPDVRMLYVTLAGIGLGILLLGVVIAQSVRRKT